MSSRTMKFMLLFVAPPVLVAVGLYAFYGCPTLWAKDFPVEPASNAHLATTTGLSAGDAALEAIHWNIPGNERVPRDRVSISVSSASLEAPVVRIRYSAQDDSYHQMFYEVTLSRSPKSWTATRLRRCWTGRGLIGWSTDTPS